MAPTKGYITQTELQFGGRLTKSLFSFRFLSPILILDPARYWFLFWHRSGPLK